MFTFLKRKKIVVVHSGSFHSDEVFAVATLRIAYKDRIRVIRTRDESVIIHADIVADVGGIYDAAEDRFDHHQQGGAGIRDNGIPYASFGLVWKKYGPQVCGSSIAASRIESILVQPIDAIDNGVEISKSIFEGVYAYGIQNIIGSFQPTWKEIDVDLDQQFGKAVDFAQKILVREIERTNHRLESYMRVEEAYRRASNKRIIVLDMNYPWSEVLRAYSEPIFVVAPSGREGNWGVSTIPVAEQTFVSRKDLPQAWAGLRDGELAAVTGVSDAFFCHNKRFLAVAKSKEGALALAELALNA